MSRIIKFTSTVTIYFTTVSLTPHHYFKKRTALCNVVMKADQTDRVQVFDAEGIV
jgi:hypothetical protein